MQLLLVVLVQYTVLVLVVLVVLVMLVLRFLYAVGCRLLPMVDVLTTSALYTLLITYLTQVWLADFLLYRLNRLGPAGWAGYVTLCGASPLLCTTLWYPHCYHDCSAPCNLL